MAWSRLVLLASLLVTYWSCGNAHPSQSVDPLSAKVCAHKESVTFFSFHAHVLFDDYQGSPTRAAALQLREAFAKTFNLSTAVNPTSCDDTNTTHGLSPPLCMIDADFGPTDFATGHYGSPACPFLQAEWAAFVPVEMFQPVVMWLMQNHGVLDVVVHPNSGCEVYDHRDWPLWIGQPHRLDLTCLHYDCPGCNIHDCTSRTHRTVLQSKAERCGLKRTQPVGNDMKARSLFKLSNKHRFCSESCVEWVQELLPKWYTECPFNCGLFDSHSADRQECDAHAESLSMLLEWSSSCRSAVVEVAV